nr:MAG TPA: Leukemia inhibitory factor receptor D2 domain [Caudoviricetes sp.]DAL65849.1 MAG TPA_asm: Leukemia inhibitory factor receptor D2 domain [Caudoviricetes sp.]DAT18167.1 MAG TPA: Leukemia inhibitory factor receptor D2 domain [Caudoviricetes sp.]DAZ37375.1 MAG TPA: Leukemia inhibitory factor receptor D2 domain [Caudoviricetes sp.]
MHNSCKSVPLQCVFHSIRLRLTKDWLSGIDSLFLFSITSTN